MSLTACGDAALLEGTITGLRRAGIKVEADRIIPPAGATGPQVIAAISEAFQSAKENLGLAMASPTPGMVVRDLCSMRS